MKTVVWFVTFIYPVLTALDIRLGDVNRAVVCVGFDCSSGDNWNVTLASEAFQRLPGALLETRRQNKSVGLAVILTGQWDLLQPRLTPGYIFSTITGMHKMVQTFSDNQAITVLCTLPQCSQYDAVATERRAAVNKAIREYCFNQNPTLLMLDLDKILNTTGADCHFTEKGGKVVENAVKDLLAADVVKDLLAAAAPKNISTVLSDRLPLCAGASKTDASSAISYARGQWLPLATSINKTFVCCEKSLYDPASPGVCRPTPTLREKVNHGERLNAQCGDGCCGCDVTEGTRYEAATRETFQWHPSSCRLHEWDAVEFCRVLGGRILLISGDSTMEQAFISLTSLIGSDERLSQASSCTDQVRYGWSSHLMTSRFHNNLPDYLAQVKPDVVVFNAGAHLTDLGDIHVILDLLEKSLPSIDKRPLFIWKSQSPAHIGCERSDAPLPWGFQYSDEENLAIKYQNWHLFPEFDALARNMSAKVGWRYLDMSPLYLRPDGHIRGPKNDCLHYCLPGPVSLFAQLLLHLLKEEETQ